MPLEATTIALIGLGLSATGLVIQQVEARKRGKQLSKSNQLRQEAEDRSQKVANLQTLRVKRSTAREAQAKRADILSTSVAQGAESSSAVQGSRGSVQTQLASNLSFLDRTASLNTQAATLFGQAQDLASRPAGTIGRSIASFGGTIFAGRAEIAKFIS